MVVRRHPTDRTPRVCTRQPPPGTKRKALRLEGPLSATSAARATTGEPGRAGIFPFVDQPRLTAPGGRTRTWLPSQSPDVQRQPPPRTTSQRKSCFARYRDEQNAPVPCPHTGSGACGTAGRRRAVFRWVGSCAVHTRTGPQHLSRESPSHSHLATHDGPVLEFACGGVCARTAGEGRSSRACCG